MLGLLSTMVMPQSCKGKSNLVAVTSWQAAIGRRWGAKTYPLIFPNILTCPRRLKQTLFIPWAAPSLIPSRGVCFCFCFCFCSSSFLPPRQGKGLRMAGLCHSYLRAREQDATPNQAFFLIWIILWLLSFEPTINRLEKSSDCSVSSSYATLQRHPYRPPCVRDRPSQWTLQIIHCLL